MATTLNKYRSLGLPMRAFHQMLASDRVGGRATLISEVFVNETPLKHLAGDKAPRSWPADAVKWSAKMAKIGYEG